MKSNVAETKNNQPTIKQKLSYYCEHITTVTHALILWFVLYVWYLAVKDGGWNAYTIHAVFYVTGWMLLMLEGIIAISPHNVITKYVSHNSKTIIHLVAQVMSAGFCLYGFFWLFKERSVHFYSHHSKAGLASLILTLPTFVNGFSALFAVQFKRFISPSLHKLIHAFCGIGTFVAGTIALYLALDKRWYTSKVSPDTVIFTKVVVLFSVIWNFVQPLLTSFERIKYLF
ncbi:uncharacterized protein LOC108743228 [Agrilus planipennis]|uniref:ascorbate ferrireductase (transmembrane) n=1 Tax=Agrilus planipennis TaxID=224129 RepID=A0A1W4XP00_AGRPL|nr:uncharacterized protein LOC108743228 [Agrilus planipennis]